MTTGQQARIWLVVAVLFLGVVYLLSGILLPFVAGIALAYILDPLVDRLEAMGVSRTWSTVVVTLVIFLVLLGGILVVVPLLASQISAFIGRAPGYVDILWGKAEPIVTTLLAQFPPEQLQQIKGAAGDKAMSAVSLLGKLLKGVATGGVAVVHTLSFVVITPVVAFYLLRDWDVLVAKVDGWLPRRHVQAIRLIIKEMDTTLAGFARGQATMCLLLAAFYSIALTLIGLDLGLIVGIGAGLVSFIPYVGAISGFVVGIGLALAQFPTYGPIIAVTVLFVVGQILEGYILTPKLVGDKVGLHAVWVIFALLAGASLFGFLGMLLAIPVAAVVGVLSRFALRNYLESPLYGTDLHGTDKEG